MPLSKATPNDFTTNDFFSQKKGATRTVIVTGGSHALLCGYFKLSFLFFIEIQGIRQDFRSAYLRAIDFANDGS